MSQTVALSLEVGCGSARLARQVLCQGVAALGLDWKSNRLHPAAPWLPWDMASEWGVRCFLLALEFVWFLWLAVPCGTLSLIREREIPAAWKAKGVPDAPPIRSRE